MYNVYVHVHVDIYSWKYLSNFLISEVVKLIKSLNFPKENNLVHVHAHLTYNN